MNRAIRVAVLLLSSFAIGALAAETGEAAAVQQSSAQPPEIALAPILPPARYSVQNRGGVMALLGLPGFYAQRNVERSRTEEFRQVLQEQSLNFGEEMATALRAALTENGQRVVSLDEIKYVADDPRTLEYKALKSSANLVLTANIDDVGLFSGHVSTQYLPRLNVTFELVDRRTENALYEPTIHYGVDAGRNSEDEILADPQYAFDSYEQAMQRRSDIIAAFREGIRKIAALVAQQVRDIKK